MIPERYRLPCLLLRKITPPTVTLLGVGVAESKVPNIRKQALILPDEQFHLTTDPSQLAPTIHDMES